MCPPPQLHLQRGWLFGGEAHREQQTAAAAAEKANWEEVGGFLAVLRALGPGAGSSSV